MRKLERLMIQSVIQLKTEFKREKGEQKCTGTEKKSLNRHWTLMTLMSLEGNGLENILSYQFPVF